MATSLAYGTITISDLSDGALSWTTIHAPTESNSNYIFEIQYLEGNEDADKKVGDLIFYDVYRYTILEVGTTTVTAGYRTSLKGDTAEWYYGTALIHTSGTASLSTSSTPDVIVGAMYLNTDTSLVYKCTAISQDGTLATWTYAGNLTEGVIDNINIGGRNLLRGTQSADDSNWAMSNKSRVSVPENGILRLTSTSNNCYAKYIVDYLNYEDFKDDYYTFSADVRIANITTSYTNINPRLYIGVSTASQVSKVFDAQYDNYRQSSSLGTITSDWSRVFVTLHVPNDLTRGTTDALIDGSMLTVQVWTSSSTVPVEFRRLKLERGNKATDWTPAPEDVENLISIAEEKTSTAQQAADDAAKDAANAQSTANDALEAAKTAQAAANTAKENNTILSKSLDTLRKDAVASINSLQEALGQFQAWIDFSVENSLVVGKQGGEGGATNYVLQLEGDCISFYEAADVGDKTKRVAYFQNHNLYVDNIAVGKQIDIGNFRFVKQNSGNLSFVYVG